MNPDLTPDPEDQGALPALPNQDLAHAPHIFRGIELQPFSVRRQIAAQALGNRLLSARVRFEERGAYDGMFADVAVLLFLCVQPVSTALRALRKPEEVLAAAMDWAETQEIAAGSQIFAEAVEVYAAILRELQEAQFRITETPAGAAPKNAGAGLPTAG